MKKISLVLAAVFLVFLVAYGAGTTVNGTRVINGDLTIKGTCTGCGAAASSTILAPVAVASITSAGTAGRFYPTFTDCPQSARDNGSSWDFYYPAVAGPLTHPPTSASGWAWGSTQGTSSVTASNCGWALFFPFTAGAQIRFFYKNATYPASSYTFTIGFTAIPIKDNTFVGIGVSDGTGFAECHVGWNSGNVNPSGVVCFKWTDQTTVNSVLGSVVSLASVDQTPQFLTVQDDLSSTISFWWSDDINNLQKLQVYSAGRTAALTPSRVGIVGNVQNNIWNETGNIFHMVGTGGFTP